MSVPFHSIILKASSVVCIKALFPLEALSFGLCRPQGCSTLWGCPWVFCTIGRRSRNPSLWRNLFWGRFYPAWTTLWWGASSRVAHRRGSGCTCRSGWGSALLSSSPWPATFVSNYLPIGQNLDLPDVASPVVHEIGDILEEVDRGGRLAALGYHYQLVQWHWFIITIIINLNLLLLAWISPKN